MERRQLLAGLAASALAGMESQAAQPQSAFIDIKIWRFHNSPENQAARTADYLQHGLSPALERAGAKLVGAFGNVIGPDGPYYVTLTQFASLANMQDALAKLKDDREHTQAQERLGSGSGLPFVRVESSLLHCFHGMPEARVSSTGGKPRIFELRTYESQTFATLERKIGMFHSGEMQIFERLGMRPVFFGETIVGPKQPNLMYMLSYDDLAARDRLWHDFGSDPEWKKLSGQPELKDPEIVANISNVILRSLPFSPIR